MVAHDFNSSILKAFPTPAQGLAFEQKEIQEYSGEKSECRNY